MNALGKRLTALEEIAEQLRRREMREFVMSCVCQSGMAHFDHREWPTPGLVLTAMSDGRVDDPLAC